MNERELLEYKKELLNLKRNALKKENQTGYPHLDRSHLQYYDDTVLLNCELPKLSMYGLLYEESRDHLENIAIEYFGRKIKYQEFLTKISDYASAFKNMGIKAGDVVSIASPNLPEIFYAIYGLNKIGAVANLIDPRNNIDRIKQFINQVGSKKLIMIDIAYPKIDKLIHDTKVDEVFTVSASDSLPIGLNYVQKAKTIVENYRKGLDNCPKNEFYKPLKQVVSENKSRNPEIMPDEYNEENLRDQEVAVIVNTSGTTGTPKGVMLTNENLNAVAYDYKNSGLEYETGDAFLGIMPSFLAYGIGVGTHMTFILGLKNIIIPAVTNEKFAELIRKHRPAHFAGVPTHYQYLINDSKMANFDLSFIKTAAAGGDAFDPKLKKKANEFLIAHGSKGKIKVGYGCSENTGLAASQFYVGESDEENELITAGIPAYYTNFRIVSPITGEDLKYNQDGEILLSGKGVMKGYVNNQEETDKVIEVKDGIRYLHTGDIGHIDENGRVYHISRIKRIIVRPDGHNVFPVYIENVVNTHPLVKACTCVGLKDENHVNGKIPVAFIVIESGHENEIEQIIAELKNLNLKELPERDIAQDYIVIEKIPMTQNGKVDYKYLEDSYTYNQTIRTLKKES